MAKLSFQEQLVVESFLEMKSGYVLNFSDRTFRDFIGSVCGLNIDEAKYLQGGTSKANRFRQFIKLEPDNILGKIFKELYLLKIASLKKYNTIYDEHEADHFSKLAERLSEGTIIEHIDAIQAANSDKDFHQLAKLIQESIEKNEPEAALDRLHVFLIKFLKELCDNHGVTYSQEETVNALYGKYFKAIDAKGFIQSEMAKKIIQFSFQVIQAFNDIRNNRSFAHDNPVLNYDESVLIFRNVTATVKFIQAIEAKNKTIQPDEAKAEWNDLF